MFPCFDSRNAVTVLIKVKSTEAGLGPGCCGCSVFSQGGLWAAVGFYETCLMAPDFLLVGGEGRMAG